MLCDSMIKEIDRVTSLITNLFTLSVKKDSRKEKVFLEPLVRELELFYQKGLKQQGISFSAEVSGQPSVWANGDELRQILHNLIGNSVKALGKKAGGVMTLSDNGCGMTREELERAAEPFYTKSINGIGLGLAIVKKLTDQNGGFFQMESQPGEGTRVSLWFPAGEEETDEPDIDSRR